MSGLREAWAFREAWALDADVIDGLVVDEGEFAIRSLAECWMVRVEVECVGLHGYEVVVASVIGVAVEELAAEFA